MIQVEELRHFYGEIRAVDGISFEVRPGETFGLLGPNGAGKSTTISVLCGMIRPHSGRVVIAGSPDPRRPAVRERLGVVPQSLALYEELTAEENLAFFGRMYGLGGKILRARVAACLEVAALTDRRASRVSSFSGGMKRRLNLACALVHDPPILLLDEPTVGVDPQSRNLLFETLAALKREGRTLIYTTHYMEEAQRLCDRVAIVDQGRLLDLDTVAGLIARHGGPSRLEAHFESPPPAAALPDGALIEATRVRLESRQPLADIARLQEAGPRLTDLTLTNPNLEDVFLNLTGRRLRDE